MLDWMKATRDERCSRRDSLAETGSIFSVEGECGEDRLPCGVCDECVSQGVLDEAGDPADWQIFRVRNGSPRPRRACGRINAPGPGQAMDRFERDHAPEPGLYEVQPTFPEPGIGYAPDNNAFQRHVKFSSEFWSMPQPDHPTWARWQMTTECRQRGGATRC